MSRYESTARELKDKLRELHPDEQVPAAYIASLVDLVEGIGKYIDDQERESRRIRNRPIII